MLRRQKIYLSNILAEATKILHDASEFCHICQMMMPNPCNNKTCPIKQIIQKATEISQLTDSIARLLAKSSDNS